VAAVDEGAFASDLGPNRLPKALCPPGGGPAGVVEVRENKPPAPDWAGVDVPKRDGCDDPDSAGLFGVKDSVFPNRPDPEGAGFGCSGLLKAKGDPDCCAPPAEPNRDDIEPAEVPCWPCWPCWPC
jgi:hypothetical protein